MKITKSTLTSVQAGILTTVLAACSVFANETVIQERPAPAAAEKPNVVLILVDDLGWQDVKCYDIDEPSPMETPNLDALASSGTFSDEARNVRPTVSGPCWSSMLIGVGNRQQVRWR